MFAKLIAKANSNLERVVTKRNPKLYNLPMPGCTIAITARKTRTLKDGSIVMLLTMGNGKMVEVTYRDVE